MEKIVLFEGEGIPSLSAKISEAYTQNKELVIDESFLPRLKQIIEDNDVDGLQQELRDLKDELHEKDEECSQLENDLDEAVAERNELEEENDMLMDEIEDLKVALSEKDEW